jgi:Pyruvate/2-oxoacid:ferredoxin oxidoreductase gamma subunit
MLSEAIGGGGFALLDVWEMCVAYYVPRNKLNRQSLDDSMEQLGLAHGVVRRQPRPEYAAAYRESAAATQDGVALPARPLPRLFGSAMDRPLRILIAGSAGQRVRTAATALAAGGVLSGLWATRRDDFPITVQTGYSLAEVILSPAPVRYTGAERPDVTVIMAPEGAARARRQLASLGPQELVLTVGTADNLETGAPVRELRISAAARPHMRRNLSMVVAARMVDELAIYPMDALREAVRRTQRPEFARANLAAIDAAVITETQDDAVD